MSLFVHRSNRVESLVDELAGIVETPLTAPLASEVVVVPSQGFERWISMRLAERFGIWGNPKFPFPRRFVLDAVDVALESVPTGGWERGTLLWRVARILGARASEPVFGDIAHYLRGDEHAVKRVQLAHRIADTFDQYAVFRPELVLSWEQGAGAEDWQAVLWRALVEEVGNDHVATRATRAIAVLRGGKKRLPGLPERACLFGLSTLAPRHLQVLEALGNRMDIHLLMLSPSRHYWGDMQGPRARQMTLLGAPTVDPDDLHLGDGHPLLESLGRLGRDFQVLLEDLRGYRETGRELHVEAGDQTLLCRVQSGLLDLEPGPYCGADESVEVHACHSPLREVEALHDRLLAAFAADSSLQPADVAILAPNIEDYAPLIDAVFGAAEVGAPGHIPYAISDRALRATGRVADTFLSALALVRGRLPAPDVLDLLGREAVRTRFGFDSDDVVAIERWVAESGIRWGQDEHHRDEVGQPALRENTWAFGMDRLMLGVASGGALWSDVLPYDDMEGRVTEVLGRFADFLDVLFRARAVLRTPRPLAAHVDQLLVLADDLLSDEGELGVELRQLREVLEETRQRSGLANFAEDVDVDVVTSVVRRRFDEQRNSRVYLSGAATFCQLLPMRSVPFRIVALLGMNHDAFPRASHAPSFDHIARTSRRGDRSLRDEDRYIFLEALLSARDQLLMFHVGQSVRDNSAVPPSVVVSELLDVLDEDTAAAVVTRHPLQPFSPAYFLSDSTLPRSFARPQYEAALALSAPSDVAPAFVGAPLPPADGLREVSISELVSFFKRPVKWFVSKRLGLSLEEDEEVLRPREPLSLNALERWGVGSELVKRVADGATAADLLGLLQARGVLPLGAHGEDLFEGIHEMARRIAGVLRTHTGDQPPRDPVPIDLLVGDTRLTGEIGSIYPVGRMACGFSKLNARARVDIWLHHLVLQVLPEVPRSSVGIGPPFSRKGREPDVRLYRPVPNAHERLEELIALFWAGQRAALPFFPDAALSFLWDDRKRNVDPETKARWAAQSARRTFFGRYGSSRNAYVSQVFGGVDPIAPDFRVDTADCEVSFAGLARTVLGPALDHEGW
jgi:exodeoxyribonuclease V gamma subunit